MWSRRFGIGRGTRESRWRVILAEARRVPLGLGSLGRPRPLARALGCVALLDEPPKCVEGLLGELVPPAEPIVVGAYLAGQATDFVTHLAGELEQRTGRLEDRR